MTGRDLAVRIAAAQLSGLSRVRTVIAVPPFSLLVKPNAPDFMTFAVPSEPGTAITDVGDAPARLRTHQDTVRFELIEQANPGVVDALVAAGCTVTDRYPLLVLDPAQLRLPPTPGGVTVDVATTLHDAADGQDVANSAFEMTMDTDPAEPGPPASGGSVVARVDGVAASTAFWTAVADGVTEIAGVATRKEFRNRGLGSLVTAHAVRAAATLAGVTLAWLTPGHDDADRIYRRVGFTPTATAVHLTT